MRHQLPAVETMFTATERRDVSFDGIFFLAVTSTQIFCRPSCPARKPARRNVRFYATAQEALLAGFRACRRCRPLEPPGAAPPWLRPLLDAVEAEPDRRWRDADLRARGLEPARVRRWFQNTHGMSFHGFHRARRLGRALGRLQNGAGVTHTAFDSGYESMSGFQDAMQQLVGASPRRAQSTRVLHFTRIETPLGAMIAAATNDGLAMLEFEDRRMLETQLGRIAQRVGGVPVPEPNEVLAQTEDELRRYFARELRTFTVPLQMQGTPFQQRAWSALCDIPYGETRSYLQQARAIDAPRAVRAVARANGDNRIGIIIPCHRVIGANGKLTGYGGGLWRKQYLLDVEQGGALELQPLASASSSAQR